MDHQCKTKRLRVCKRVEISYQSNQKITQGFSDEKASTIQVFKF